MSRSALALLPVLLALSPQTAPAQEHYTLGPISRIILVDIKPCLASLSIITPALRPAGGP